MMVSGFIVAHVCLLLVLVGFVAPRYYDAFIPPHRRAEGTEKTLVNETKGLDPEVELHHHQPGKDDGEAGLRGGSATAETKVEVGSK